MVDSKKQAIPKRIKAKLSDNCSNIGLDELRTCIKDFLLHREIVDLGVWAFACSLTKREESPDIAGQESL